MRAYASRSPAANAAHRRSVMSKSSAGLSKGGNVSRTVLHLASATRLFTSSCHALVASAHRTVSVVTGWSGEPLTPVQDSPPSAPSTANSESGVHQTGSLRTARSGASSVTATSCDSPARLEGRKVSRATVSRCAATSWRRSAQPLTSSPAETSTPSHSRPAARTAATMHRVFPRARATTSPG